MKYCLSSRQTQEYLDQADQMRVQRDDINQLFDFLDLKNQKEYIYNLYNSNQSQKDTIENLIRSFSSANEQLILAIINFDELKFIKNELPEKIRWFYSIPVNTLEEAEALKNLGSSYIIPNGELAHQLPKLKIKNIPVRYIPNIAHLDPIPRNDGVIGNWIRPEDLETYSLYIDTIEFGPQPLKREQTLYNLYSKDKEFYGDLSLLVQDLNVPCPNAYLNSSQLEPRLNCGLKCATHDCTLCHSAFKLANQTALASRS